ncbi:MAG: hypothetical protein NTY48_06835 [Candidatus Diapherotrites archaeon]|nr:hypothetical protein [Candidatus Diapherotrites archaeon]
MPKQEVIYSSDSVNFGYTATAEKIGQIIQITLKSARKKILLAGRAQFSKESILCEISQDSKNITFCSPFFGLHWPKHSAPNEKAFIQIPKQLTPLEELEAPSEMRKYLQGAQSSKTRAWLNLNGKMLSLNFFGFNTDGSGGGADKSFLDALAKTLGIQIKQI